MRYLLYLFAVIILCGVASAQNTYYVDTAGSNSNTCTQAKNTATPKATLGGASGAISCATAGNGDIIQMRAGTHVVGQIDPPSGTSYANALTITNYPGETVTINGLADTDPALWISGPHSYVIIGGDVACTNGGTCHFIIDAGCTTSMSARNTQYQAHPSGPYSCASNNGNAIKWTGVAVTSSPPNHIRLLN